MLAVKISMANAMNMSNWDIVTNTKTLWAISAGNLAYAKVFTATRISITHKGAELMGAVGTLAPTVFLPRPKVVLILAPTLFSPVWRQWLSSR